MRPSAITVPSIFTLLARSSDPQPPKRSPPISPVRAYTRKQQGRCKMINTPNTGCPVLGVFTTRIFRFVAFSGPFSAYKNRKAHDLHRIFNGQSWVFFGALEGTRIPGPLIKRIQGASFVKFQKFEETLFLSHHRKTRLCTHRIVCIQCNTLQPLSSYSGVQKVCKNVQTGKTKPNGQINHRFYGRV